MFQLGSFRDKETFRRRFLETMSLSAGRFSISGRFAFFFFLFLGFWMVADMGVSRL